jgi:peptidyl-tRNA hydrolase ICT1
MLHSTIRESPYYARKSNNLVIQADESRNQFDNTHACRVRLHKLILDSAARTIPGETSDAQKVRVQKLYVSCPQDRCGPSLIFSQTVN